MVRAVRAPQAARDLIEIADFIAEDNVSAAIALLRTIDEKIKMLAENPGMGKQRDDLQPGLRSYPVKSYLIFYRAIDGGIEVARILSGYRDIDTLF